MTPTPPSTTSSHSGNSPDTAFRIVRKRNRIPLSCAPCRHRKLKCNRQHPCDNCTKRGDSSSCSYAAPTPRKKGSSSHNGSNATPDDMQNRIDRLEGLVLSLMTNGAQAPGTNAANEALSDGALYNTSTSDSRIDPSLDESQMMDDDDDGRTEDSETEGVTKSFGVMKVDAEKQKTFYVGEAHWAALLNEIGEVKNYFVHHKKEYEEQMERVTQFRNDGASSGSGPALLFGATVPPSRSEILAHLPSRYMSDILIGRYFNTFDPATHILHGPTFQKQYNNHWSDPSKTSIVWIAMLFAMMRLAMLSYAREGDEPPEFRGKCRDMSNNFRTQMAHCLITADYTKPHNHIIETLIFHLHAEYTTNRDSEASVWVLVGMIARLAMRMGYHRDSKLFPNLTPYQGEMRRRVWSFVRQADLLFSFQVALPAMIRIGDSDTELPRNIHDDEFNEDSTSLPAARSSSEATPVSYMIAKSRLAFGFGRVLEEINTVHGRKYDEILKIDRGLRDIFASIPEHLKLRPMAEQSLSPITLIMARFSLATVYHKSQLVLHRRFIRSARSNSRYMHSRRICVDSAMQLLSFQATQFSESGERGRMKSLRNYVNSLATHDFLLAATVLCHDLYYHRSNGDGDASTPSTTISGSSGGSSYRSGSSDSVYIPGLSYRREDLLHTLETSRDIWRSQRDVSMEAYKASELLNVLLRTSSGGLHDPTSLQNISQTDTSTNAEQNAAMTLGLLQSGAMTPNTAAATLGQAPQGASQQFQQQSDNAMGNKFQYDNNAYFGGSPPTESSFGNGLFGAIDSMSQFPSGGMFGSNQGDAGGTMNVDWEAWDQYMQPQNFALDPAASLWSSNSPPDLTGGTQFPNTNTSATTTNPSSTPSMTNELTFGHFGAFQSTNTNTNNVNNAGGANTSGAGTGREGGPILSPNSPQGVGDAVAQDAASSGEVFMGARSPPAHWKWGYTSVQPS